MKCHRCAKVATLHITEIVKQVAHELHLCEDCARQYLSNAQPGKSDPGDVATAGKSAESESGPDLDEMDKLICPTCKLSFKEFRSQGRLGCANCYHAFQRDLVPLLVNIHGETKHVGKFPKRAPTGSQKQYQLIKLRNELRVAIAEESYEEAARLRDRIQSLETELTHEKPA